MQYRKMEFGVSRRPHGKRRAIYILPASADKEDYIAIYPRSLDRNVEDLLPDHHQGEMGLAHGL